MKRKRATAIVETSKGILLVSHSLTKKLTFMLPGGGIKLREKSADAIIRELYEETGLNVIKIKYLFDFESWFNNHKVFLIKTKGKLRKRNEIRHIAFWNDVAKNKLKVTGSVIPIIQTYKNLGK